MFKGFSKGSGSSSNSSLGSSGAGVAREEFGAGDVDADPFLRLRRRAERSVSGFDSFEGWEGSV